ncbi:MAG: HD domain-containing protein [Bacilli bacterium]|jgi:uncharacterized protein|uniref:HD domain-containing protein n=1 Tax=uncultured Clostridium sp. TaxID=59620 RepID=UPI00262FDD96|nr:HD domain-containing protein [uncultured Clostridium sp.]MCI8670499.1 HD domain-containing protein [Bacilli bacterium]MCX4253813.1 HD domain-containing protein [Bacilli bacterium]
MEKSLRDFLEKVDPKLVEYVQENIFPEYLKNDLGHGIFHIKEVIRRAFMLNENLDLKLDDNMIFAMASFHDLGKYINHEIHEQIAASKFMEDEKMKEFFSNDERNIIKEAILDHRSSFRDNPRSIYGKLISSADRNTSVKLVFIRSFFVGQERTPDMTIEEFLDFTFKRLTKRYSILEPERMFLEDNVYKKFLEEMRELLCNEELFKNKYCSINRIVSRTNKVREELGRTDLCVVDFN